MIHPRDLYAATRRMAGRRAKHLAAALGVPLQDALPYWPAAQRIMALREQRAARRRGEDPLLLAARTRPWRRPSVIAAAQAAKEAAAERRRAAAAEREAEIRALLASPTAMMWRADLRRRVEAAGDPDVARAEAVRATLEAVARLARRSGWTVSHTSRDRGGRAASRYLMTPHGEVRVSDHAIPTAEDRPWSIAAQERQDQAPRWRGEIIVGSNELTWSPTKWRRALLLAAAGRR